MKQATVNETLMAKARYEKEQLVGETQPDLLLGRGHWIGTSVDGVRRFVRTDDSDYAPEAE